MQHLESRHSGVPRPCSCALDLAVLAGHTHAQSHEAGVLPPAPQTCRLSPWAVPGAVQTLPWLTA